MSAAIRYEGGAEILNAARKFVPLSIGDVAVTTAGNLPSRFVFHVATIDYDNMIMPNEEIVRAGTRKCMNLAETLGVKHIAFPALGTGAGRFPFSKAAETITKTIADHLLGDTGINTVTLALYQRVGVTQSDLNIFYENAVAVASLLSQSKRLNSLLTEMETIVTGMDKPNLLRRLRELGQDMQKAQGILDTGSATARQISHLPHKSRINELAEKAINIADKVGSQITRETQQQKAYEYRELELMVLRTKLAGLLTLVNVKHGNLNKLQQKAANYGAEFEVPLAVENAIDSLKQEISEAEAAIGSIRQEMAQLING